MKVAIEISGKAVLVHNHQFSSHSERDEQLSSTASGGWDLKVLCGYIRQWTLPSRSFRHAGTAVESLPLI